MGRTQMEVAGEIGILRLPGGWFRTVGHLVAHKRDSPLGKGAEVVLRAVAHRKHDAAPLRGIRHAGCVGALEVAVHLRVEGFAGDDVERGEVEDYAPVNALKSEEERPARRAAAAGEGVGDFKPPPCEWRLGATRLGIVFEAALGAGEVEHELEAVNALVCPGDRPRRGLDRRFQRAALVGREVEFRRCTVHAGRGVRRDVHRQDVSRHSGVVRQRPGEIVRRGGRDAARPCERGEDEGREGKETLERKAE